MASKKEEAPKPKRKPRQVKTEGVTPPRKKTTEAFYVLCLYDGVDHGYTHAASPIVSRVELERLWFEQDKETRGQARYEGIDYCKVFPADTLRAPNRFGNI